MQPPFPELTRAEEQVMQLLWQLGPSYVKDVREALPTPLPALTTVSTIVRILEQKGFVGYEPVGRGYRYHALVAQDDYRRFSLRKLLRGYFGGSFGQLVSFFAQEENLDAAQLDALLRQAAENPPPPAGAAEDSSPTQPR
jgi:predicted transcriptional regulator